MDYLGEAGIGNALLEGEEKTWPWFNGYCGDIDLCGFKKPQSYYRDVVWGLSKLEMAVKTPVPQGKKEIVSFWGWPDEEQSWNWQGHNGEEMGVTVYTRCDSVLLELNNVKVNSIVMIDSMKYRAHFIVPYEPGELKAIGYLNGSITETKILKSTGPGAAIRMKVDHQDIRADRNDLAYITIEVVNKDGLRVPDAEDEITFDIKGAGELAGVGNGNPTNIKSFQQPVCTTFRGRCLLIVRPNYEEKGEIVVSAKSENLDEAKISIKVVK